MGSEKIAWVFAAVAAILLAAAAAPLIRTGWWPIRILDFPRMQIAVIAAAFAVTLLVICLIWGWSPLRLGALATLGLVVVWEGSHVAPYTRWWPDEAPPAPADAAAEEEVCLLIVNLDYRNAQHAAMRDMIEAVDPDLLLLVELDERWESALAGIRDRYDWRLGVTRDEGLGLALWSRLPVEDERVRHLVHQDRASLWATLELPDGRLVRFVGVHPTPPGLERNSGSDVRDAQGDQDDDADPTDNRHDSRIRDAELVLVAREVQDDAEAAWVVAGDFNDVAWSHTTRLFKRLSGLQDPRIGRGLLNTYHSRRPLLRYPLDHTFISAGFGVHELQRVRAPGSDHFAVKLRLHPGPRLGAEPAPEGDDREEASEMIEEGRDDAVEAPSG